MLIPTALVFLAFVSSSFAFAVREPSDHLEAGVDTHFVLNPVDAASQNKLNANIPDGRVGFPGDLTLGYRLQNEVVYTRTIAIDNPSDETKTGLITFSTPSGTFHFVSARNRAGSVGVMCDEPYTLGGSETGFKVRSQPNSRTVLDLTFAAH